MQAYARLARLPQPSRAPCEITDLVHRVVALERRLRDRAERAGQVAVGSNQLHQGDRGDDDEGHDPGDAPREGVRGLRVAHGRDGGPPNNYPSFFSGSAWEHDETTDQWYLHYFAPQQPDLNWEHEAVRREVYDIMRFWLDKGVAGFRMDVIPFISKQPGLPDLVGDERARPQYVYANGPRVHEFLHEMHTEVLGPYDAVSIGEAFGVEVADIPKFTDVDREELSMIFQFDLVRLGHPHWRQQSFEWPTFKRIVTRMDTVAGTTGWNTSFLANHDNPRMVSQFGDDRPEWREASAKALATWNLTQRATPFIYQGDELGMTNYPFTSIEQYDDVEVRGLWRGLVETGKVPAEELLEHLAQTSRDHSRTPVQWTADAHGGFTTGTPWLAVNPNHTEINAAAQLADPDSVFHHYRKMIALRKTEPLLVHGHTTMLIGVARVLAATASLAGAGTLTGRAVDAFFARLAARPRFASEAIFRLRQFG